jgi:hypothetical protein
VPSMTSPDRSMHLAHDGETWWWGGSSDWMTHTSRDLEDRLQIVPRYTYQPARCLRCRGWSKTAETDGAGLSLGESISDCGWQQYTLASFHCHSPFP